MTHRDAYLVERFDDVAGVDDLAGAIRDFAPGPQRRLGILVDHLVAGPGETVHQGRADQSR